MPEFGDYDEDLQVRLPDPEQTNAREFLKVFFDDHREEVFFSRQIEVQNEHKYFHWVTNRALRDLVDQEMILTETRELKNGGSIKLLWHKSYRYFRRTAARLIELVEDYSDPNIGAALGLHGETMILEGFARSEFVMKGRHTHKYAGREWTKSEHNLDFIFERDSVAYGVEVKNTLGYMEYKEFSLKMNLCEFLNIRPVFVVRMIPKSWIKELISAGGFALIFKYQLYPWSHRELAKRVADQLNLPVDAPRTLEEGTMARFLRWHEKQL